MSKSEQTRNRRNVCIKQLDRIEEFAINKAETATPADLNIRLNALETCFDVFLSLQSKLEDADPEEVERDERSKYEELYYTIRPALLTLLDKTEPHKTKEDPSAGQTTMVSETIKLPKAHIPTFTGIITEWMSFCDAFNSLVHSKSNLSNVSKFHYLIGSLEGNAALIVKSLEVTDANYAVALRMLQDRYENRKVIVQEHLKQLFEAPLVQKNSASSLRNLLDTFNGHLRALSSLGRMTQHWDDLIVFIITSKLDTSTLTRWQEEAPADRLAGYKEICNHLNKRSQILEGMVSQMPAAKVSANNKVDSRPKNIPRSLTTTNNVQCALCSRSGHVIPRCYRFLRMSPAERKEKITFLKLCENCLKGNHVKANCKSSNCRNCGNKHHTLLLNDVTAFNPNASEFAPSTSANDFTTLHSSAGNMHTEATTILATAIIHAIDFQGSPIACRVLLDSGSQINFVNDQFAQLLGSVRTKTNQSYSGISSFKKQAYHKAFITIKSRINDFSTSIEALILPKITSLLPSEKIDTAALDIPSSVTLADPAFDIPQKIDVLIGAELFFSLLLDGKLLLGNNNTLLQNTVFGWVVTGRYPTSIKYAPSCHTVVENDFKHNQLDQRLKRFWEIEERSIPVNNLSKNESECERHFLENYRRTHSGRYQVRLPFRCDTGNLGASYHTALRRFLQLEGKFKRCSNTKQMYIQFINEYIQLNHMDIVQYVDRSKPHFYLPHHCIFKPSSSTTKLRVVFDGSAKSDSGKSLNEVLMGGPVVQPDLFSIALRFRMHRYVFTADITKMYRQIIVDPRDRDFQLILWRDSEEKPISTYRLCTVTYGTSPASYLATRSLKQLAIDGMQHFPRASKAILSDFYVDDVLTGSDSLSDTKQLQGELIALLKTGRFELRKWCSNSPLLLEDIPTEYQELHFQMQASDVIKTLGIMWDPASDTFMYKSENLEQHAQGTKRSVLSDISQLFDPLGLVNPVIVLAKIFMKQLWRTKLSWDDPLPQEYEKKWTDFRQEFTLLQHLRIPRLAISSLKVGAQIHAFANSSEQAYGTCVYIRCFRQDGSIQTRLLAAKSKVAPTKNTCLPRLELCAAEMMAQFVHRITQVLRIKFDNIYYWTDSSIVLAWLSAESSTWKTFIANRVSSIQETTTLQQWRHIDSKQNPADIVSRGARPSSLIHSEMWFLGPKFLRQDQEHWPSARSPSYTADDDVLERRKVKIVLSTQNETDLITEIKYHNSYNRLLRVISYMYRFKFNSHAKGTNTDRLRGPITATELKNALRAVLKLIQGLHFEQELEHLHMRSVIPKRSNLRSLTPFLDTDGLIRVGGRLKNSNLTFAAKHPILLPTSHVFTSCIIQYLHRKHGHLGPQNLLAIDRQQFWPINGRILSKRVVRKCILCARCRPKPLEQLMGDLPTSRVLPARPFSTVGIDFCGPFLVHYRRRGVVPTKAYVSVFTCFITRAIHLELVEDLTAASFIAALRRFVGRRGLCSTIYSDNGLNFIGARNELHEIYKLFLNSQSNAEILNMCAEDEIKRTKWTLTAKNVAIGTLVVLKDDSLPPLKWKMARIVALHPGSDEIVRVVTVKTSSSILKRSIAQICILPVEDPLLLQGGEHVN